MLPMHFASSTIRCPNRKSRRLTYEVTIVKCDRVLTAFLTIERFHEI